MSIRELRADATDAAFDSFGDDFELLATGPDAGPQPVREIWTRPGSKTGMGQLDVLAERPNRVLALRSGDARGVSRESRIRGADVVGDDFGTFRVDSIGNRGDGTYRLELTPVT